MKRKMTILLIGLILVLLLVFPDIVSAGAEDGLMLWFSVVFPALLPFMILSGVIVRIGITSVIGRVIYPLAHKSLHISKNGCYPVVIGLLSGYPLGAKTVADMCCAGNLSRKEGQYLLRFCNNASPMFLLEYMGIYCMGLKRPYWLLLVVYASAFLNAFFHRKDLLICDTIKEHATTKKNGKQLEKRSGYGMMEALDESILDAFLTLAKVGAYIILFSILAQLVEELLPLSTGFKVVGLGMIEITTGGEYIRRFVENPFWSWLVGSVFCAFGGFSSVAQTASVIQGSGLSIRQYIQAKFGHACLAGVLAAIVGYFLF